MILKCLSKNPADRYSTTLEVTSEIENVIPEVVKIYESESILSESESEIPTSSEGEVSDSRKSSDLLPDEGVESVSISNFSRFLQSEHRVKFAVAAISLGLLSFR